MSGFDVPIADDDPEFPAVVVDGNGEVVDGAHRIEALEYVHLDLDPTATPDPATGAGTVTAKPPAGEPAALTADAIRARTEALAPAPYVPPPHLCQNCVVTFDGTIGFHVGQATGSHHADTSIDVARPDALDANRLGASAAYVARQWWLQQVLPRRGPKCTVTGVPAWLPGSL